MNAKNSAKRVDVEGADEAVAVDKTGCSNEIVREKSRIVGVSK